ncbi:MAG: Hsp20/alpha crystallin family protein [Nitrospirales bacterium]
MLVKWDPFREIEQTLGWWGTQPFRRPLWDDRNERTVNWAPAVNVYEDTESLYLETQLPGIDMKDVNISVTDRLLEIHGERKVEHEDNKDGYHFREAHYGTFGRSFNLPKYVTPNEAKATYDKGVLIVKVPKQEEAKPKLIPIESK